MRCPASMRTALADRIALTDSPASRRSPRGRPTGEGRTVGDRVRLSSCREPASRNPRTNPTRIVTKLVEMRTGSPSLHARPSSEELRASFRLSPRTTRRALRLPGQRGDRCDRPTSANRTNDVNPYLACSRLARALARSGGPAVSGDLGARPGEGVFHDTRDRFGGPSRDAEPRCLVGDRAWALSTHGAGGDRASDTPVASPPSGEASRAVSGPGSPRRTPRRLRAGARPPRGGRFVERGAAEVTGTTRA